MVYQSTFTFNTRGRGTYKLTTQVEQHIRASSIRTGICSVFIHHTSASLIITENADPSVRRDLETILRRLAPDGDPAYEHDDEGDDDMSGHVRCMLTRDSLSIPVTQGASGLGTWQGIFLYEHRFGHFSRRLTVTILGE
ncbi:MAG TPA: secondary thiamine-phosphate synthase enzyme YjbQ [Thiolinea sp.]|nr:secondary thiamine-phosphate synthase enzyme YjbQ [Thiolinea sp.]